MRQHILLSIAIISVVGMTLVVSCTTDEVQIGDDSECCCNCDLYANSCGGAGGGGDEGGGGSGGTTGDGGSGGESPVYDARFTLEVQLRDRLDLHTVISDSEVDEGSAASYMIKVLCLGEDIKFGSPTATSAIWHGLVIRGFSSRSDVHPISNLSWGASDVSMSLYLDSDDFTTVLRLAGTSDGDRRCIVNIEETRYKYE